MLRASLFVLATVVFVPLSVVAACNDVETTYAPDAGNRVCDPGPFAFGGDNENHASVVGLGSKPSAPACSSDGTTFDVINKLPRGGWYLVGWSAQINGTQDKSGQGECLVISSCRCVAGPADATPAPTPTDAGADADAAAEPAPEPSPSSDAHWDCR